ncbi:hypothetical protein SteCoe_6541 [Stentor coeruleus]|uniref:Uncharacterized protein n=1 Tax=Stentor coeruleus TaxID=5963 RepID=A0A1R2CPR0_9CILI|nr:hypothetical protein SteCoe_6541 [Stentor coeruleus]
MEKNFPNIIELSEEHEISLEEIPNTFSSKLKPQLSIPNYLHNLKDPNYLKILENMQEFNKYSEQEINLTSTDSEKPPKDYQLQLDPSILKTSKFNQEIAIVKMKNFQEKFFFQIIKLSEASNHYLTKFDIKISNLEYLCQKIIQKYKTTEINYEKLLEKYRELVKERIVLQEKADNNNALMISLRMAIESMNFTREQVSRLSLFDDKRLYKSFLDKIQAFEESVKRYDRMCRKDHGLYEEFDALNRENAVMKEKIAQVIEENCRAKGEIDESNRKNTLLVKEINEKEQKINLVKKKIEDFAFVVEKNSENIEDQTNLKLGKIEDKIKDAHEILEIIKIGQKMLIKPMVFNEENADSNKTTGKNSICNEDAQSSGYEELDDKYKKNLKENLDLKAENTDLVSKLDTVLYEKNSLALLFEEKSTKLREIEKQLKKSMKIIEKLENQNMQINEAGKMNLKISDNIFPIQENSVSLQKKSRNVFESSDYNEKISELASKIDEKNSEVENLTVSMKKLEINNNKLTEKCRKLMMKIQKCKDLEENTKDFESENKILSEKIQDKEYEITKLKNRVKKLKSKKGKLMKNVDKLTLKVDRLEKTNKWLVENENINEMMLEKIGNEDIDKYKD